MKPQYAPRAFVPLTKVMENGRVAPVPDTAAPLPDVTDRDASSPNHEVLQGIILKLEKNSVTVLTPNEQGNYDDVKDDGSDAPADRIVTVPFSYALYALGAGLPAPSDVWGEDGRKQKPGRGQKAASVKWLSDYGEEIKKAKSVLVVGGGALGIRMCSKKLYKLTRRVRNRHQGHLQREGCHAPALPHPSSAHLSSVHARHHR